MRGGDQRPAPPQLQQSFRWEAVAVDIFDNRVEAINSGGLWGKSRADLADGRSCCRNATIMRLMSLVPLPSVVGSSAESKGSGIPLMMAEMTAGNFVPPEFCPTMDHFKVILKRPQGDGDGGAVVSKGEALVEAVLREFGQMSVRELSEKCGMSLSQARRHVNSLIARGVVEPTALATSRNREYLLV